MKDNISDLYLLGRLWKYDTLIFFLLSWILLVAKSKVFQKNRSRNYSCATLNQIEILASHLFKQTAIHEHYWWLNALWGIEKIWEGLRILRKITDHSPYSVIEH